MPSPNNPPTPEFFSGAQNPSLHDSILSNTSGDLISLNLNVTNNFTPGNFHSLAQLSSENQDLVEEYPALHGLPAPGKSNNPFALNRNNLEVDTTGTSYLIYFAQADDFDIDPPFTNSSNESLPNAMGSSSWSSTNSSLVSLVSLPSTPAAWG